MPRIPMLNEDTLSEAQRQVLDAVRAGPRGIVQGPLLAAIHNPVLADRWQKLGALLRYETSIPPRLSELAILVTAQRWRCEVEWGIHKAVARGVGLQEPIIESVRRGERPDADAETLAIYDFAAELQRTGFVSEPAYQRALAHCGVVGVVELTAIVGYYTMVAMTLNAHQLPMPEGMVAELSIDA